MFQLCLPSAVVPDRLNEESVSEDELVRVSLLVSLILKQMKNTYNIRMLK